MPQFSVAIGASNNPPETFTVPHRLACSSTLSPRPVGMVSCLPISVSDVTSFGEATVPLSCCTGEPPAVIRTSYTGNGETFAGPPTTAGLQFAAVLHRPLLAPCQFTTSGCANAASASAIAAPDAKSSERRRSPACARSQRTARDLEDVRMLILLVRRFQFESSA
ncbi:MAG: hypothetical protein JNM80_13735 [Phycisphaerae bacterium]|nr:hypothetical protein [Phycisphaerae bacterium]